MGYVKMLKERGEREGVRLLCTTYETLEIFVSKNISQEIEKNIKIVKIKLKFSWWFC